MEDILWSKDIEDMKNSWMDKGYLEEDAMMIAQSMHNVENVGTVNIVSVRGLRIDGTVGLAMIDIRKELI